MTTRIIVAQQDEDGMPQIGSSFGPELIAEIPYTELVASATYNVYVDGILHRNARERTFVTYNTTDQSPTAYNLRFYDSAVATNHFTTGGGTATATLTNPASNGGIVSDTSENDEGSGNLPILASHTDSVHIILTMGDTAPTTGSIQVYVTEVF